MPIQNTHHTVYCVDRKGVEFIGSKKFTHSLTQADTADKLCYAMLITCLAASFVPLSLVASRIRWAVVEVLMLYICNDQKDVIRS